MDQLATVEAFPKIENLPVNENLIRCKAGTWVNCQFKVMNKTEIDWDTDTFLTNDFGLKNYEVASKKRRINYLMIEIFIPKMCDQQTVKIKFNFFSK